MQTNSRKYRVFENDKHRNKVNTAQDKLNQPYKTTSTQSETMKMHPLNQRIDYYLREQHTQYIGTKAGAPKTETFTH